MPFWAIIFIVTVVYGGFLFVQKAYQTHITSESYLKFPMWIPYLIMPIGGMLLALRMGERLIMLRGALTGQKVWRDPFILVILAGSSCSILS